MAHAVLGKWGKNLAVRLPLEVVKAVGFHTGQTVDVEARGNDIVIRRADAAALANSQAAAEEVIRESAKHSLGGLPIRELIDEGRR